MTRQFLLLLNILLVMFLTFSAVPCFASQVQWNQQSSQQGRDKDLRLEKEITLVAANITVRKVLQELSLQSECTFTCGEKVAYRPITVSVKSVRLKDFMAELADFLLCDWYVDTDRAILSYDLVQGHHLKESEQAAEEAAKRIMIGDGGAVIPPQQQVERTIEIQSRLKDYVEAVTLSDADLLNRYEQSDPWLCATMLNPVLKPFILLFTKLSDDQVSMLSSGQALNYRLDSLPENLQSHVWLCVTGRFGDDFPMVGGWRDPSDETGANRFADFTQRWAHTTLRLQRVNNGIQVYVEIPDIAQLGCQPIWFKDDNPSQALRRLARVSGREHTEESERIIRAAVTAWELKAEQRHRTRMARDLASRGIDRGDASLKNKHIIPWQSDDNASATQVLLRIASVGGLSLLADSTKELPESVSLSLRSEQTLDDAIQAWVTRYGGETLWVWSKPMGRFLQIRSRDRIEYWAGQIPSSILAEWDRQIYDKQAIGLLELADLTAHLTPAQAIYGIASSPLVSVFQSISIRPEALQILNQGQLLSNLLNGKEVSYQNLTEQQRQVVLTTATNSRPWVKADELTNTKVVLSKRSGKREGYVSIIFKYKLPDAPTDLDVFATCRLSATLSKRQQ